MKTVVTILAENTTPVPALIGEYGFAALIEAGNYKILFDTGSGDAMFKNAEAMGIDLATADAIVISHGHFDHTGGLLRYLKQYGPRPVYAHSGIFVQRPVPIGGGNYKDIGCGFSREELEAAGGIFHPWDDFGLIASAVYLSGAVPRGNSFEDTGANFTMRVDGEIQDDPLVDDSALIIDHPDGLIIVSGCAHSGMVNIIKHACRQTNREQVLAFIGGTHLINASQERIEKTVAALRALAVSKIVVSHCTGFHAASRLYQALGERVVKGESGTRLEF